MGRFLSESAAACLRSMGIRTSALPPADEEVLKLGRGHSSCKECLPLIITTGSLLKYVRERSKKTKSWSISFPPNPVPAGTGSIPFFSMISSAG